MAKRPRCEGMLPGLDAENATDVLEEILSSLQAMQIKAAGLSKVLRPTIAADSRTSSWWSYAMRRVSEYHIQECSEMSIDLHKDIEKLMRFIAPKNDSTRKRSTILVSEVLVDVFMPLGRPSLDALQLTCRRFNRIVAEHLKDNCLRVFHSVSILNLEYAPAPTEKGVYRLTIQADYEELKSPSVPLTMDYLYESRKKLPALAWDARDALGGVRVGTLIVHDTERGPRGHPYLEIPAADLVPLLNSFAAIRALELQEFHLTSAGHDFLDFCRTKGIMSAEVMPGATVEGDTDVDAVMRFCFGPVSKEAEADERRLQGFSDFHASVVSRMHEAARSKPKHDVKLSFDFEDGGGVDELRLLLDSNYQWDSEKNRYFLKMDNGVTLRWQFNETEVRIECKLVSSSSELVVEADSSEGESAEEESEADSSEEESDDEEFDVYVD